MERQEPRVEAIFHGDDKAAAIERAKKIGGYAIYSKAPSGDEEPGYWSDPSGFTRTFERIVWPAEEI